MKKSSIYPNIQQSFKATGIIVLMLFVISWGISALPFGSNALLQYALPMLLAYLHLRDYQRKNSYPIPKYKWSLGKAAIYPLIIISTIGILIINTFLASFIPMPEFVIDLFESVAQENIFTVMSVVLAAPILEELIFRGVILNGLLKNYSPTRAILISSVLFGLVHLNPWQFIAAFNLGLLAGWLFYRTGSIIPAFAVHFTNNLFATLPIPITGSETTYDTSALELYGHPLMTLLVVAITICFITACVLWLKQLVPIQQLDEMEEDHLEVEAPDNQDLSTEDT